MGREGARESGSKALEDAAGFAALGQEAPPRDWEAIHAMQALAGLLGLGVIVSTILLIPSVLLLPVAKWRATTKQIAKYSALSLMLLIVAIVIFVPGKTNDVKANANNIDTSANASAAKTPDARLVAGKPGLAKVCLTSDDLKLDTYKEITIPATAIFSNNFGVHAKIPGDPRQRDRAEPSSAAPEEQHLVPASLVTTSVVTLTKASPCAAVEVKMYVGRGGQAEHGQAADNLIFDLDGVVDYPVPEKKPPVEFGKLIDDMSVSAVLTADVAAVVNAPAYADEAVAAANCLKGAANLARYMGSRVGRQTSSMVEIEQTGAGSVSFGCGRPPWETPDLNVGWEKRARPSAATSQFVGKAGEYLIGAKADELRQELSACVEEALKPESHEIASREFRGAKIECQAFSRDGGGGSATVYRRFGAYPVHASAQLSNADAAAPPPALSAAPVASPPAADGPTCSDDWTKCADNEGLANNYAGMAAASAACKREATARAKYGTPEWPWLPFGSFKAGSDAPRTGVVVIAENDAKFSNQFGAMAHVTVRCTYDLRAKTVLDVAVEER